MVVPRGFTGSLAAINDATAERTSTPPIRKIRARASASENLDLEEGEEDTFPV